MKKLAFILSLAMVATACMAQKSNVKKAKSLASSLENPDFAGAREAIRPAFAFDETRDQAETYYVAGLIGYQENNYWMIQGQMGNSNDDAKGKAVEESYEYWLKADKLAQVPNEKGKIDTKTRKSIQTKMLEYYKAFDLVIYGANLYDQKDYKGAYKAFKMHVEMPDLEMMQDPKVQAEMPRDTTYMQYKMYEGLSAMQADMHEEAIRILLEMKDGDYEPVAINQFLYQELQAVGDTIGSINVLKDAMVRFPQESWFVQNLINYYIFSGHETDAIAYLDQAIEREPSEAQYYRIRGNLKDQLGKQQEAIADFEKAIELNPESADSYAGLGYVYVNIGNKQKEEADYMTVQKDYDAKMAEANATFAKAIPFFEKAHELDKDNTQYALMLRQLYYRMQMTDKYEKLNAEING